MNWKNILGEGKIIMAKKGIIEEIFSRAIFANDSKTCRIFYRNYEKILDTSLFEFIKESNNFQNILATRIEKIMKNNRILFEKKRIETE